MRSPSDRIEINGSLSLRLTTLAKKPRTECACQPVAAMMAAMVVPSRSNANTFACLVVVAAEEGRGVRCKAVAAGFCGVLRDVLRDVFDDDGIRPAVVFALLVDGFVDALAADIVEVESRLDDRCRDAVRRAPDVALGS